MTQSSLTVYNSIFIVGYSIVRNLNGNYKKRTMKVKFIAVSVCCTMLLASCGGENEKGNENPEENTQEMPNEMPDQTQGNPQQPNSMPQGPQASDVNPDDFSDEVLKDFITIDRKLQVVQQEKQGEMVEMVEASDLSVEEFQKISAAKQQGQEPKGFDESQMSTFESLSQEISALEGDMMKEFEVIIDEEGYDMDSYRNIAESVNASPELQQRLQGMMQQNAPQNGAQPQPQPQPGPQ